MQAQLDQEGQEDPEESPNGQEPDPQGFLNPELHLLPPKHFGMSHYRYFPLYVFPFPFEFGLQLL